MTGGNFFKNICKSLGENNKPTYVVMAIATVKGICRPMFTMMDKTENPETKKYTALREGLTEIIAIPAYWGCGEIASKFGKSIVSKDMDRQFAKIEANGHQLTEELKIKRKLAEIKKGQKGLMFIGVCTAALFIIPALCSLAIKPIMDKMGLKAPHSADKQKKNLEEHQNVLNLIEGPKNIPLTPKRALNTNYPQLSSLSSVTLPHTGMKVGGV